MRTTMTRYRGYKIITTDMYGMYDVRRSNGEYIGFGETITEARNIIRNDIKAAAMPEELLNRLRELYEFWVFAENKYIVERDDSYKDEYDNCEHDLRLAIDVASYATGVPYNAIWKAVAEERTYMP